MEKVNEKGVPKEEGQGVLCICHSKSLSGEDCVNVVINLRLYICGCAVLQPTFPVITTKMTGC